MKTTKKSISNGTNRETQRPGEGYVVNVAAPPKNKTQALEKLKYDFDWNWTWTVKNRHLENGSNEYRSRRKKHIEDTIQRIKEYLGESPKQIVVDEKTVDATIDTLIEYLQALKRSPRKVELLKEFSAHQALTLPGTLHYNRFYSQHQIEAHKDFLRQLQKELKSEIHNPTKGREPALPESHRSYLIEEHKKGKLGVNELYNKYKQASLNPEKKASRTTVIQFLKKVDGN